MNLLNSLKEKLRPELHIKQEILERERKFNEEDPSRESWVLKHVYLSKGNLKELEKHPEYDSTGTDYHWAYYASPENKKGPCKKVVVNIPSKKDKEKLVSLIEKKLKLDLHSRNCNAGVFYKIYEKGNFVYAEAVPAVLTGE